MLVLEVLACFRWRQLQSWPFLFFFCGSDVSVHCWCLVLRTKICSAFMREPEICESLGIQFRVSKLPRFMKRVCVWRNFLFFSPLNFPPYEVRPGIFSGAARILNLCFRICCVTAKTCSTAMTRTVNTAACAFTENG